MNRCICGGEGWVDEHMPSCSDPDLLFYVGCCNNCERNTGEQPNVMWAEVEWDLMNCPEGCLVFMDEVGI